MLPQNIFPFFFEKKSGKEKVEGKKKINRTAKLPRRLASDVATSKGEGEGCRISFLFFRKKCNNFFFKKNVD